MILGKNRHSGHNFGTICLRLIRSHIVVGPKKAKLRVMYDM